MLRWPRGLDAGRFLAGHWQRRPLLWRGALDVEPELPEDALFELACDREVESRLVVNTAGSDWRVEQGPFDPDTLASLPDRDWTLLVQDVDKRLPAAAELMTAFDFVPRWRRDDVMISLAAPGGSVGPHVDRYDVFLLQSGGTRRWRYDPPGAAVPVERDAGGLRLLAGIPDAHDEVLAPGDMLYLPPGAPHYGVAVTRCMTWSIGFRAPSAAEILAAVGETLQASGQLDRRYADPDLRADEARPGEIGPAAVARIAATLPEGVRADPALLAVALGRLVTEPKAWLECEPGEASSWTDVERRLAAEEALLRSPRALFAFVTDDDGAWWFVDGEAVRCAPDEVPLIALLAGDAPLAGGSVLRHCNSDAARALLLALLEGGHLYWRS